MRSISFSATLLRSGGCSVGLLSLRPSTRIRVLFAAFSPKPRMLTTTPRPPSPMVSRICRPARARSTSAIVIAPLCSISSRVITLTAAGLLSCNCSVRMPVTMICSGGAATAACRIDVPHNSASG